MKEREPVPYSFFYELQIILPFYALLLVLWVPAVVAFPTVVPVTVLAIGLMATGFPFPKIMILIP
jgi:hypothetical protein